MYKMYLYLQHQNIITMAKVMEFSEIVRICEQKKQTGDILTLSKMLGYTTVLEYYLGINPQTLTDDEWAEKFAQLQNIREQEAKTNGFSG